MQLFHKHLYTSVWSRVKSPYTDLFTAKQKLENIRNTWIIPVYQSNGGKMESYTLIQDIMTSKAHKQKECEFSICVIMRRDDYSLESLPECLKYLLKPIWTTTMAQPNNHIQTNQPPAYFQNPISNLLWNTERNKATLLMWTIFLSLTEATSTVGTAKEKKMLSCFWI